MSGRCKIWTRALLWLATAALAVWTAVLYVSGGGQAAVTAGPATAAGGNRSAVLDVNAAGTDALEELPGIGPVLAERIVDHRTQNGPFDGPEALMEVPGIGPAVWEDIGPFVYFGE